jgi:hypothetical protein
MLGLSLDTWTNIMLSSLAAAALAAAIVGVSTYSVVQLQKKEAVDAQAAFEQYKISAKRDSEVAIAKAHADADVKINSTRDDANLQIERLHQQNLILEKQANDARLQTEQIKQVVAWRSISVETADKLRKALSMNPGRVNLRFTDGDPEALFLAIQLSKILSDSGWQVAAGSEKSNSVVFGIILPDPLNEEMRLLREAFTKAQIPFSTEALPDTGTHVAFNVASIPGAPTLMVGSRSPMVLQ